MITKKYNLINNITGWVVFIIALASYWLTLEPTASYWDCGEFIIQADKLEIGHPPGNPIFMLTARFFANFASSPQTVALMVNAMSGLLSALTILLLFWTITHLTRRLLVRRENDGELSVGRYLAIMGSGVVGALAYAWSDTFWFSAVEAEVYAYSSFCTALVFWLILKWENRAGQPHSDAYLILIAYIIGVSVAVHLLNLLCIPAIALVFAFRKFKDMNVWKSLATLGISFAIIVLVLYGLVPGFIKVAQMFELFCVNTLHMSFNTGVLLYAVFTVAVFLWCLYELYKQQSANRIRISFILAVAFSGMLCFTHSGWVWFLLLAALAVVMFTVFKRGLPVRVLTVIMWSIAVIFVGYSSYALILIRSSADTPMNQNSPDNVFDLASYLNREQYGDTPLLYGETYHSDTQKKYMGMEPRQMGGATVNYPMYNSVIDYGEPTYGKGVKGAPAPVAASLTTDERAENIKNIERGGDHYVIKSHTMKPRSNPELNMLFPRVYSSMPQHQRGYEVWAPSLTDSVARLENTVAINAVDEYGNEMQELDVNGNPVMIGDGVYSFPPKMAFKPSMGMNLEYFFRYQFNHMYMRYFMWNFAGRQNDVMNMGGELDAGNWISGIPFIDNARLGDQSKLPPELGKENPGHNVFYMLPLLLGLLGLFWQAFSGKRGVEQFWVVFFLFFMTGIAIILYLNQPPYQPRERDYAYAGSFYAFAIWIGMGVAALWRLLLWGSSPKGITKGDAQKGQMESGKNEETEDGMKSYPGEDRKIGLWCGVVACLLGICVPLQMVSQTWDDHDRSGRTAARDYAINYLESTEPNAIIFCNGDNDTFPLWYAQEVEGIRPDVRIINLSYLSSDWYANQLYMQAYESAPVPLTAKQSDIAYDNMQITLVNTTNNKPMALSEALKAVYSGNGRDTQGYPTFPTSKVYIDIDKPTMVKQGYVAPTDTARLVDRIELDLAASPSYRARGYLSQSDLVMLDIIATNAATGWKRPIYWCSTVGSEYYMGLDPYQTATGLTLQLVPWLNKGNTVSSDRFFNNVDTKFLWGGADNKGRKPYYDETAGRMITTMRNYMLMGAQQYYREGNAAKEAGDAAKAQKCYAQAQKLVEYITDKQPAEVRPYGLQLGPDIAKLYYDLGVATGNNQLKEKGRNMLAGMIELYARYVAYEQDIRLNFGNVALTIESQQAPLRFWGFVEMYREMGGDYNKLKAGNPVLQGLDEKHLQEQWNEVKAYLNNSGLSEGAMQIEHYASMLVGLKDMTPEQYSNVPEETRQIDSMFYSVIENPDQLGATAADVSEAPSVKKLDMKRQERLYKEYQQKAN